MAKSLFKSFSAFSGMTFLSRVAGLVRDITIATVFGASAEVDAFFVAFKIPNFFRRLFAEGAFSQAFVPILTDYQENQTEQARQFLSRVMGTLGVILLGICFIGIVCAPLIISVFAPGFVADADDGRFALATQMLRITFPYLLFISLTAFSAAVLNSLRIFAIPAFAPVILNLCLITGALLSHHFQQPVMGLALAVLCAGLLQWLYQMPFLKRQGVWVWPRFAWRDPGVQRVVKLIIPAIAGVSVAQIGILIDTLFASFLPHGSITWLYFSERLMGFPLGVYGVALSTVVLPYLSRANAREDEARYLRAVDWALRMVLLIALPAMVGLVLLAGPLMATLFQHGAFTPQDVTAATKSLWAYSFGLPAFMLVKVLGSAFYSKQDIKRPVKIAACAVVLNIILNSILIHYLFHAGLALATSLAAYLNAALLFFFLRRRHGFCARPGWGVFMLRLMVTTTLMGAWVVWQMAPLEVWLSWSLSTRVWQLLWIVIVAKLIYFATLYLCGLRKRHLFFE